MYFNKGTDSWSVRTGRDMGGSSRVKTVVMGMGVFLQCDIPGEHKAVVVSHAAPAADHPAAADVRWLARDVIHYPGAPCTLVLVLHPAP